MTSNAIMITGASSGIGAALAEAYATPGRRLILCGRDTMRLSGVAQKCSAKGAVAVPIEFDLHRVDEVAKHLIDADTASPIDLAIFNAGLGGTTPAADIVETPKRALEVATVNFTAAVVGATAIAERMARRGRGHIVFISSIAETFPLPMAPTYSGSKAGLRMFAEALALALEKYGVRVTVVAPGFVDTPMSRQVTASKPFMVSSERAAKSIRKIIERRRR
ncbi:MAG: SDR family NAD(P)-dependent oxidoreductase, partial [Alphaproteobacteria bacterium]|nr:SDR family NAD(P)-dependent oxidoreductase [Alphaproteobacteria bacterium]